MDVTDRPRPYVGSVTQLADAAAVGPEVVVRPSAPADRIDIGTGTKTVVDALAESGIPARLRPRWPVIEATGRVALIPRVRTAGWAWRGPGTTRYLVARITVIGPEGT